MMSADRRLLIVGEPIVAYQRVVPVGAAPESVPFTGPWPSGSPVIAAYIAGALGMPTRFVGAVGDDDHGRSIRDRLHRVGVDVKSLQIVPNRATSTAYVTELADGTRHFDFRSSGTAIAQVAAQPALAALDGVSWVHLSGSALLFGEPLSQTVIAVAQAVAHSDATLSIDPNLRPQTTPTIIEHIRHLVSLADVVFPSVGELAALSLTAAELATGGAIVVTTAGSGAVNIALPDYVDEADEVIWPPTVDEVDADGAGDTFAASFIAARSAGHNVGRAVEYAAARTAQAVTIAGPTSIRFERSELLRAYGGEQ